MKEDTYIEPVKKVSRHQIRNMETDRQTSRVVCSMVIIEIDIQKLAEVLGKFSVGLCQFATMRIYQE